MPSAKGMTFIVCSYLHFLFSHFFIIVVEQILEAAPQKTAAGRSLTSHLLNHPCKRNKTCKALWEKTMMNS